MKLKAFFIIITTLLAALCGAAQEDYVVFEGAEQSYFVEDHPGSDYSWRVLTGFNPDAEADPNDYSFIPSSNTNEIGVRWKSAGIYYLDVIETDITGCTNRKVVAVKVNSNNRIIVFNSPSSLACYSYAGNGFDLPIQILDDGGVPLDESDYPVDVAFSVNETSFAQRINYDQQILNIDDTWFTATSNQESTVTVKLTAAQDQQGTNIPVVSANNSHVRTIGAIPMLEFVYTDDSVYQNESGQYEINLVEGNTENVTYHWYVNSSEGTTTDASVINSETATLFWDGDIGSYSLKAWAKDGNGCIADTIETFIEVLDPDEEGEGDTTVVEPPIFFIYAGTDTTVGGCEPYTFTDVFPTADTFTYLWEPAEYLSDPTIANPVFTPEETTTFVLTVSTLTGVTASDTVQITVSDIYAEAGDDITVGEGEAVTLNATQSVGNSLQYFWTSNSGTIENGADTPTPTVRGEGMYYVQITDFYSCTAIDSVMVIERNDPASFEVFAGPDVTIGSCQPYVFDEVYPNEDSYTYSWQPDTYLNDSEIANPIFTPGETTTYVLTVSTLTGVTASDTVQITVSDIYANAGEDFLLENESTALLNGMASFGEQLQYIWTTENGAFVNGEQTATPEINSPGKYFLTVTDSYGCTSTDSVVVSRLITAPIANDDYDTTDYQTAVTIDLLDNDEDPQGELDLLSLQILQYPGNGIIDMNGDGSVTYTPNEGFLGGDVFQYSICNYYEKCDNANVYVYVTSVDFFIPEAFTPNGDNVNDYFEIKGIELFEQNSITIINRWGNTVYKAQGYGIFTTPQFWDGKSNQGGGNNNLPSGTYFYVLDLGNGEQAIAGSVYIDR